MSIPLRIALFCLLCTPAALAAQEPAPQEAPATNALLLPPPLPVVEVQPGTASRRFARMVVPATLGSAVGLVTGAYTGGIIFYEATGCCGGGDDPGLTSGLYGAVIGATLGSMIGAYATRNSEYPVSFSRAFLGATVGIGGGVLAGIAGAHLDDFRGLLIGFTVGQGTTTALFAVPYP